MSEDNHKCEMKEVITRQSQIINTLRTQQSEIHAAVCGDMKPGAAPGILSRINALELKFKIGLGVLSSGVFIGILVGVAKLIFVQFA